MSAIKHEATVDWIAVHVRPVDGMQILYGYLIAANGQYRMTFRDVREIESYVTALATAYYIVSVSKFARFAPSLDESRKLHVSAPRDCVGVQG